MGRDHQTLQPAWRPRTLALAGCLLASSAWPLAATAEGGAPSSAAQPGEGAASTPASPTPGAKAPAADAKPTAAAALHKPAPDFTLTDTEGQPLSLKQLRGKVVVLEWFNPDCPFVKYAHGKGPLRDLAKQLGSDKLVWLTINSGAHGKQGHGRDRNRAAKAEYGIENVVLLDEAGVVGRKYGAEKTPHLFVIDAKGRLVYRGGLDNAPMGVVDDERPRTKETQAGQLEPYLQKAIEDLEKKRKLRLADTPAYGCSVKY